MPDKLQKLLKLAKSAKMSLAEREQQRRSFAFGNGNIENSRISQQSIAEAAERLTKSHEHTQQ